ncbi:MAG: hypothetical protein GXO98_03080 [Nitrospirae bacterium]|nr:hypothetical protein [Nitrospirota bacterium]
MRDKKLERKIETLREFIKEWIRFRDFLKGALKDKNTSAEGEKQFLEIKSLIARKYQGLTQDLGEDFLPDKRLMDIISHVVSLESMAGASDMQFRKVENDWHLTYIDLNKLLGNLESERDRIAHVSGIKKALNCFAGGVGSLCRGVVKVVLVLIVLAIAGLIGSYFISGDEIKKKGLVNYLVTTVKEIIPEKVQSEEGGK